MDYFVRTKRLLGEEAIDRLSKCKVAVFGIGGVGGYVVEALVRSGIGSISIIDNDEVCVSNINRQIIATNSTIGRYKVDVMKERILDINPEVKVSVYKQFYLPDDNNFVFDGYDYIVDAIDTITGKIGLVMEAKNHGIPIISSMGAGNKLDPTAFKVADIYDTKVCPLAKVMRRELKKRGIEKLKVVYSEEEAITPYDFQDTSSQGQKRQSPGSIAFVPSVVGLIMAGEVIKDLSR